MIIPETIFYILMFIFGAIFGSFACCQAWRIHLKETGKKNPGKWSVCLSCGKRLKPSENIPVISWLFQRGKCKKCGAKIGKAEILSELGLGLSYVALSTVFVPEIINALTTSTFNFYPLLLIFIMIVLLISVTIMWILLVYDAKWQLLPTKLLVAVNIFAAIYFLIRVAGVATGGLFWQDLWPILQNTSGGIVLLAGVYFLLYFLSKEKLVGSGDWLLALSISIILGDFWLCLLVLFLSNFIASFVGVYAKFKKGQKLIPFGPFLIIAFFIIYTVQNFVMISF